MLAITYKTTWHHNPEDHNIFTADRTSNINFKFVSPNNYKEQHIMAVPKIKLNAYILGKAKLGNHAYTWIFYSANFHIHINI
jgi:hypothetical protein